MEIKELKSRGKLLLKKNSYWLNVVIVFIMALNIDAIISLFTTDYEQFFSLFTPSNFNWANIKEFVLDSNRDNNIISEFLSMAILLFETLFLVIFRVGGIRYFLKLRKNQATSFNEIFGDFKNKTAGNIVAVSLVKLLTCVLWMLLGIIPGIIKIFQYWAVEYILALRPDITASEALDLSKKLMKGNKLKAFVLDLAFIHWLILSWLTLGLFGYLYVTPYYEATHIEFFSSLREEAIEKGIIKPKDLPDYEEKIHTA